MYKISKEWKDKCYGRHLTAVNKLNRMSFKDAENYCKQLEKEKGSIAARELWKSTEHYARELARKELERKEGRKILK